MKTGLDLVWFRFTDPTGQDKAFPLWGYGTPAKAQEYADLYDVDFIRLDDSHIKGIPYLFGVPDSRKFFLAVALED